jgi:glutamate--cysteine ligase
MPGPERVGSVTTAAPDAALHDLRWGIERETHRVLRDGTLSTAPHPPDLRKPDFTRDFAESQLEIVTAPGATIREALFELDRLTAVAQRAIGDELLWPFSMPPRLPAESRIPIARLGSDEDGRRARAYREGLSRRYGKVRQMICGVHVNVSLGASLISRLSSEAPLTTEEGRNTRSADAYALRLVRNLYAELPLLILLYGASPVLGGGQEDAPHAVSYRNSRHGYARDEFIPYLDLTSFDAYLDGLRRGLRTLSPSFARLGLVEDGRVVQLNANVFQTDKEFYAPIRLRQVIEPGESAVDALARRGVGYVELRFFDVDPSHLSGITDAALRLLHLFLLDALSRPSTPLASTTLRAHLDMAADVALSDPRRLATLPFLASARARLARLEHWAERLDAVELSNEYRTSLAFFRHRLADPSMLPSSALAASFAASGADWTSFGIDRAMALGSRTQEVEHALAYAGI